MKGNRPRIMIAGTFSGGGKTTVTCGLLTAFAQRGIKLSSFKCGPDYIDPMFHSKVIGAKSRNLDLFLTGGDASRYLLAKNSRNSGLSIIEGVMGFYDGVGGKTTSASSFALSEETETPVVLVVDCKGMSISAAAQIKGFLTFRENKIRGVILNRAPVGLYGELKEFIEAETGIHVFGYLPVMKDCSLDSRHLGLVTADEVQGLREKLDRIARQMERSIDLDGLIKLADTAPYLEWEEPHLTAVEETVRIAVAQDNAFCFYYEDNLELLRTLGAELIPFSPLKDTALPEYISGLYFGGGYPELYAAELEQNCAMRDAVRHAVGGGMPCLAECGGFMYLHQALEDTAGRRFRMAGVLGGECFKTERLKRFGYATLTAREDTLLCPRGGRINVHEFHYWDSTAPGKAFCAEKPMRNQKWECIVAKGNLTAGFPHLHFYSDIGVARRFVRRCMQYGAEV